MVRPASGGGGAPTIRRGAPPVYQVVVASDATGHTAEVVVRAALVQFRGAKVQVHVRSHLRTAGDVRRCVREAHQVGGLIVHTLVSAEMRSVILTEARAQRVPTIDLLGPLLLRLEDLLALQPMAKPGIFRDLDAEYRRRFEVMDFTVRHDDGQGAEGLLQADLILVGVSRTSKTPLSMFLAWRGLRVGNVPIVHGLPLPEELMRVPIRKVIGLTMVVAPAPEFTVMPLLSVIVRTPLRWSPCTRQRPAPRKQHDDRAPTLEGHEHTQFLVARQYALRYQSPKHRQRLQADAASSRHRAQQPGRRFRPA